LRLLGALRRLLLLRGSLLRSRLLGAPGLLLLPLLRSLLCPLRRWLPRGLLGVLLRRLRLRGRASTLRLTLRRARLLRWCALLLSVFALFCTAFVLREGGQRRAQH
jgi:hypothetical protein